MIIQRAHTNQDMTLILGPVLRWRSYAYGWDEDVQKMPILPGGTVKAGKRVVLTQDHVGVTLPTNFTIYAAQGELMRRFRAWRGKPQVVVVDRLKARGAGSDPMWSDTWTLPTPPGRRTSRRLLFEDDLLHQSPVLRVSRLGSIGLRPGLDACLPVVPGLSATFSIDASIIVAVDPLLDLSVMTPWGEGADDLSGYLYELAVEASDDDENPETVFEDLKAYLGAHLPSERPPGWEFRVRHRRVELRAGQRADITVEVDAPNPGSVAFAIQMIAIDSPDGIAAGSDLFIVEKPPDEAPSLLCGDGDPKEWHPPNDHS